MDLEELMKQKELLQAEIARAELDGTPSPLVRKNGKAPPTLPAEDEVILLDDSSEGETEVKQSRRKKSRSRERRVVISTREYGSGRGEVKRYRSRSREKGHREVERYKQERVYAKDRGR